MLMDMMKKVKKQEKRERGDEKNDPDYGSKKVQNPAEGKQQ